MELEFLDYTGLTLYDRLIKGMGEYYFLGLNLVVLNEDISMYTLSYRALHFTEDKERKGSL